MGLLVLSMKDGRLESFITKLENEGNVNYEEAQLKLIKGHLTISKAVKWVVDLEVEEETIEESKDLERSVMECEL